MASAHARHGVQPARPSTVVAIDLGSSGTGFAYSIDDAGPVKLHHDYPDAPRADVKTLTAILYHNTRALSIGWSAQKEYLRTQAPGAADPGSYRLLTGFKLLLHDPELPLLQQLPPGLTVLQLIADFLSLFKKYVISALRSHLGPGSGHLLAPGTISWVLTVPALWDDRAKGVMRDACIRAGIVPKDSPEQLVMAVEPEAAALHARQEHEDSFQEGRAVMVVDAGGGTVDWTVHNVITRGGQTVLAEAAMAVGHPLGSLQLDRAFLEYFRVQIGEEVFDPWKEQHPAEVVELLTQWEGLKRLFKSEDAPPPDLALALTSQGGFKVDIPIQLQALVNSGVTSVHLSEEVMKGIFDGIIDQILEITLERIEAAGTVDKVLLVGGFGSAPYLRKRLEEGLWEGLQLLQAPEVFTVEAPSAAVLTGGVLFGQDPSLIRCRKSRYTYGIRHAGMCDKDAPGKFWHEEREAWFSDCLFRTYVRQGDDVEYDDTVVAHFKPLFDSSSKVEMPIYIIDGAPPRYIDDDDDDMHEVCAIEMDIDPHSRDKRLVVEFKFGRAEVVATSVSSASAGPQTRTLKFTAV